MQITLCGKTNLPYTKEAAFSERISKISGRIQAVTRFSGRIRVLGGALPKFSDNFTYPHNNLLGDLSRRACKMDYFKHFALSTRTDSALGDRDSLPGTSLIALGGRHLLEPLVPLHRRPEGGAGRPPGGMAWVKR